MYLRLLLKRGQLMQVQLHTDATLAAKLQATLDVFGIENKVC